VPLKIKRRTIHQIANLDKRLTKTVGLFFLFKNIPINYELINGAGGNLISFTIVGLIESGYDYLIDCIAQYVIN
jgi:hypothetical protein